MGTGDKIEKLDSRVLDEAGLAAWFVEMAGVQIETVSVKDQRLANSRVSSLQEAQTTWLQGSIVAIQVRWLDEEHWWTDTVVPAAHGVRRVRIRA